MARSRGAGRRSAINQLLVFTLAVYGLLAVFQKDAWPFSVYPLMSVVTLDATTLHTMLVAEAVDTAGREWIVDPLAWSPLYPPSTLGWFDFGYPNASSGERESAMRFLLSRAEAARSARAHGARYIGNRAVLGPFAAPDIYVYGIADQPSTPFHALRIYRVSWNPSDFIKDPDRTTRKLICEFKE